MWLFPSFSPSRAPSKPPENEIEKTLNQLRETSGGRIYKKTEGGKDVYFRGGYNLYTLWYCCVYKEITQDEIQAFRSKVIEYLKDPENRKIRAIKTSFNTVFPSEKITNNEMNSIREGRIKAIQQDQISKESIFKIFKLEESLQQELFHHPNTSKELKEILRTIFSIGNETSSFENVKVDSLKEKEKLNELSIQELAVICRAADQWNKIKNNEIGYGLRVADLTPILKGAKHLAEMAELSKTDNVSKFITGVENKLQGDKQKIQEAYINKLDGKELKGDEEEFLEYLNSLPLSCQEKIVKEISLETSDILSSFSNDAAKTNIENGKGTQDDLDKTLDAFQRYKLCKERIENSIQLDVIRQSSSNFNNLFQLAKLVETNQQVKEYFVFMEEFNALKEIVSTTPQLDKKTMNRILVLEETREKIKNKYSMKELSIKIEQLYMPEQEDLYKRMKQEKREAREIYDLSLLIEDVDTNTIKGLKTKISSDGPGLDEDELLLILKAKRFIKEKKLENMPELKAKCLELDELAKESLKLNESVSLDKISKISQFQAKQRGLLENEIRKEYVFLETSYEKTDVRRRERERQLIVKSEDFQDVDLDKLEERHQAKALDEEDKMMILEAYEIIKREKICADDYKKYEKKIPGLSKLKQISQLRFSESFSESFSKYRKSCDAIKTSFLENSEKVKSLLLILAKDEENLLIEEKGIFDEWNTLPPIFRKDILALHLSEV